jgi:membrane protein implicated in regulation of membrane protease activity
MDEGYRRWLRNLKRAKTLPLAAVASPLLLLPLTLLLGSGLVAFISLALVLAALAWRGYGRTLSAPSARRRFRPLADAQLSKAETRRAIEYAAIRRRWARVQEQQRAG